VFVTKTEKKGENDKIPEKKSNLNKFSEEKLPTTFH
jgi:hypothetical protein